MKSSVISTGGALLQLLSPTKSCINLASLWGEQWLFPWLRKKAQLPQRVGTEPAGHRPGRVHESPIKHTLPWYFNEWIAIKHILPWHFNEWISIKYTLTWYFNAFQHLTFSKLFFPSLVLTKCEFKLRTVSVSQSMG